MTKTQARRLEVRVQPRAGRAGVEELGPGRFKVRVTAAPEKGRANRQVLNLLAAHLSLPPSRLIIRSGRSARSKVIEIVP